MVILKLHKKLQLTLKVLCLILVLIVFFSALDIASDIKHHAPWLHIGMELGIISLSIIGLLALSLIVGNADSVSLPMIRKELDLANFEARKWREENKSLIRGLTVKIKSQFSDWGLTNAECEIGFLLLKGFSLKEIASFRNVSERTVREQAIKIYFKSKLNNRSELTAFFLEDLLADS